MRGLRMVRGGSERGSGGASLSWAVLTPVLFALIFGGVAVGFRVYGAGLAQDAANIGARAAAVLPVSASRGHQAAQDFLDSSAAGSLADTTVTVVVDAGSVTVTVTGTAGPMFGTVTRESSLVVETGDR